MSDVKDKLPYEILHPHQTIEIIASPHFGRKTKYRIKITWDDDYKRANEESFILSI